MKAAHHSPFPELSPQVIHRAIVEGSPPALVQLYRHYQARMRHAIGKAAYAFGRRGDIEDLTQEVWTRLLRNDRRQLRHYDPTKGDCGRFLRTVAYQQAWHVLHRARNRVEEHAADHETDALADDDAASFVGRIIYDDERRKLLQRFKAQLSDKDWLLLLEHHVHGRTLRSIAQQSGENESALQQRNRRLKQRLARLVEEMDLSPPSPAFPSPSPPTSTMALVVATLLVHPLAHDGPHASTHEAPVAHHDAFGDPDDA
ncbi:MAG: sigma-70 family RNA polymerase sigma factor [Myxococcota bacterium]